MRRPEYRTSYAPYCDTFGSADDDVREYLLDLNRMILDLNKRDAAVEELEALLSTMSPGERKRAEATLEGDTVDLDKPLTPQGVGEDPGQEGTPMRRRPARSRPSTAGRRPVDGLGQLRQGRRRVRRPRVPALHRHEQDQGRLAEGARAARRALQRRRRGGRERQARSHPHGLGEVGPVRPAGTTVAEEPDTPTFAEAKRRAMQREEACAATSWTDGFDGEEWHALLFPSSARELASEVVC